MCFYREIISNFNFSTSTIVFDYEKKIDQNFKINNEKKVLWFLFDEFDPEIAFKNHQNENFMHNFKKLMNIPMHHLKTGNLAIKPKKPSQDSISKMCCVGTTTIIGIFNDPSSAVFAPTVVKAISHWLRSLYAG